MWFIRRYYSLVLFLSIWQIASHFEWVPAFFLPSLTVIASRAYESILSGQLPYDIFRTMSRSLTSVSLAVLVGVPLGAMMGRLRPVRWFFSPLLSIGLPTPKVSFLPIFILWFGFADLSKIMLTFFACTFSMVNMTYLGTMGIDHYLIWSARNMGTSERKLFWRVILPAALPQIFNGFQIAFPVSLIVVSVSEMLRGGDGIGAAMMQGARFADMPVVFVNLMTLALVGTVSINLLARLRRRLLHWHEESQAGR